MRHIFITVVFVVATVLSSFGIAWAQDGGATSSTPVFEGTFLVRGVGADDSVYTGFAVVEKHDQSVTITWEFDARGVGSRGYGIIDEINDIGSYVFIMPDGVLGTGLLRFYDGAWNVLWSPGGSDSVMPETMTPTEKTPEQLRLLFAQPRTTL